jgi:hypothetical protein
MYPVYQLINPAIATPICLIAIPLMLVYAWLRDRPSPSSHVEPRPLFWSRTPEAQRYENKVVWTIVAGLAAAGVLAQLVLMAVER